MELQNLLIECRYVADESRESPGRLVGTLLTYGETSRDRPERFLPDSLLWDDGGIILNEQHNRSQASIMRIHPFLDGDILRVDQPLAEHPARARCCNQHPGRPVYRP